MERSKVARREPRTTNMISRRSVIGAFGTVMAIVTFSPFAVSIP